MDRTSIALVPSLVLAACSTPAPVAMPLEDAGRLGGVGAACAADTECRAGLTCFTGPEGGRAWPSGYCTRPCTDEDCPSGALCGEAYVEADGTTATYCLTACERVSGERAPCRDGYTCASGGTCRVGCSTDAECELVDIDPGTPRSFPGSTCEVTTGRCVRGSPAGGEVGDTCVSDLDCRGPSGVCIDRSCYRAHCDLGGVHACSAGQVCVGVVLNAFQLLHFCAPTCEIGVDGIVGSPGRCRASEACVPPEADFSRTATTPFCSLTTPGGGAAGSATATIGDACTTIDDCPNPLGYGVCSDGICAATYCATPMIEGRDICGPGAGCAILDVEPSGSARWVSYFGSLGVCQRRCDMDPTVCEGGSVCSAGFCTP